MAGNFRWRSVPTSRQHEPDFGSLTTELVPREFSFDLSQAQRHSIDLPWLPRLAGRKRLVLTFGLAHLYAALFSLLFWGIPALVAHFSDIDLRTTIPIAVVGVMSLFVSYVAVGHKLLEETIRGHTRKARDWDETRTFEWVREQDWDAFLANVEKIEDDARRHGSASKSAG